MKNIIYIENKIINKPSTRYVLNKIKPDVVIEIDSYKDLLNQPNSNWKFEKKFQKFILAHRNHDFYYKASSLPCNFKNLNYYYNLLAINCIYMCNYCYLQGMYNTPHIVLFLNNSDYFEETKKLVTSTSNLPVHLAISYDTDLVLLENYYPYCSEWIDFASKVKDLEIEIRTKSPNIDFIENFKSPVSNVIISFTILPEIIKEKFEPISSDIHSRIRALQKCIEAGWKTILCIDPIIKIENYKNIYLDFLSSIFKQINYKSLYGLSIGIFRMNYKFFRRIQICNQHSDLYTYKYHKYSNSNLVSYSPNEVEEILEIMQNFLQNYKLSNVLIHKPDTNVY